MTKQYIKLIQRQLSEIEIVENDLVTLIGYSSGAEAWKNSIISELERIYGRKSKKNELIKKLNFVIQFQ